MTSTIELPDEFEEFRARSYSGGCKVSMLHPDRKEFSNSATVPQQQRGGLGGGGGTSSTRSPCPAEFDTSDSEDDRTRRRGSAVEFRSKCNRSPSPRPGAAGTGSYPRGVPGLKVPRNYRTRSASPQSSLLSARSRARMKVEELRKMMAKKSEDSQDEYYKNKDRQSPAGQRRRSSPANQGSKSDSAGTTTAGRRRSNPPAEGYTANPLDARFLSHMSCVVLDEGDEMGDMRPRLSTEPTRTLSRRSFIRSRIPPPTNAKRQTPIVHTVRHFAITSKGSVVSQGEYLSKSSTSLGSYDSGSTTCSAASEDCEDYVVVFVGDPGVGKNALIEKFLPQESGSSAPFVGKLRLKQKCFSFRSPCTKTKIIKGNPWILQNHETHLRNAQSVQIWHVRSYIGDNVQRRYSVLGRSAIQVCRVVPAVCPRRWQRQQGY